MLEFSSYKFEDHDELCVRAGINHKHQILFIPPLFAEMNRMRRVLIDAMRILEKDNIGTTLPDLPGTNESLVSLDDCDVASWQRAMTSCLQTLRGVDCVAAFRGGALLDDMEVAKNWRLSPVDGKRLLRSMIRTKIASDAEDGISGKTADIIAKARDEHVNLGGHNISPGMFQQLQEADPEPLNDLRTCKLTSETKDADGYLEGSFIWLRSEPDADPVLSASIAEDIANWVRA